MTKSDSDITLYPANIWYLNSFEFKYNLEAVSLLTGSICMPLLPKKRKKKEKHLN